MKAASAHELGVWYSQHLAGDLVACVARHQRCSDEAQRLRSAASAIEDAATAIHAYFPQGSPCVALVTAVQGLLHVVATASLLRDGAGPCLVTALHSLCDRSGAYEPHFVEHGLMALAMSNERLGLAGREWACYDRLDVAILSISEDEAEKLGGAFDVGYTSATADLWIAYGFPQSSNKQRHRLHPLSLQCMRMVLYNPTLLPLASGASSGESFALHYDANQAFDSATWKRQAVRSPRGCSGGLVAGYYPDFGCWIPEGIVTEWYESDKALVVTSLRSVFSAV